MVQHLKYAMLSACLTSLSATAVAQTAAPEEDPFADPYLDPALDATTKDVPQADATEGAVDVLDLYGFRETTDEDDVEPQIEPEEPPPFTSETPVFEGIPEGVADDVAPTPVPDIEVIDPETLETELFKALDEQPETVMPDEMEADSEFLEEQGLELPSHGEDDLEPPEPEIEVNPALDPLGASVGSDETTDESVGAFEPEATRVDLPEDYAAEDENESEERMMNSMAGARLRVLDKISGAAEDIEISIGHTGRYRTMDLTVRACYQTPPEELPPESAAYIEVNSNRRNEATGESAEEDPRLFSGWMFASSPGLNAMEHSIYDVWVINCTDSAPVRD